MSSLCETCDKEIFFKCPWVMCGVPVRGWVAKRVRTKEDGHTYKVFECPKYKSESSNKARCRICGKVLEGKRREYCSKECADKGTKIRYRAGKPQKTCVICGSKMSFGKQKYCSEECYKRGTAINYNRRRAKCSGK